MTQDSAFGRRALLRTVGAGAVAGLAGCSIPGTNGGGDGAADIPSLTNFRGSGPLASGRPQPGGTSIEELPALEGELNLAIGGGEGGIYSNFVDQLQQIYPDFTVYTNSGASSSLAQTLVQEVEAGQPSADVFWSIDAGSLAYVTNHDAYASLSSDVTEPVPAEFHGEEDSWVGVTGRARAVPYNTNKLSASDIPDKVQEFPETAALQGTMGWAPTYGAFKSFVTAMRLLRGPEQTKQWLVDMRKAGTKRFPNEYVVSSQVADGALAAGFANHYYAMRVKNRRPDAPIDLAFTTGDAGALVNVAGTLIPRGSGKQDLAELFIRHLLSAEAQEFFATVSFAYPMIEGVDPVAGLPPVTELNPPEIDLSKLSDIQPTLELMREAGVEG
ncbi:MAG: extracellular solute-binding protein [Halobacteriaceae archaeon]